MPEFDVLTNETLLIGAAIATYAQQFYEPWNRILSSFTLERIIGHLPF